MIQDNIDPIAFSIGTFSIRWYGLMYLIGFLGAFWFCVQRRNFNTEKAWSVEDIADLLFYAAIGVIFGGTLGYWLIYEPSRILSDPLIIFKFWLPGRSFHGGLIGVLVAIMIYCRIHRRHFLDVCDFIAPAVPIGLATGRIGNFLNGELWGKVTNLPWGMVFPNSGDLFPRHPTQLYEFFLEGVALFFILYFYSKKKRSQGAVMGLFILGYGLFRFIIEFVREPDLNQGYLAWNWLTMGQLLSIPMIVIGLLIMGYAYKIQKLNATKPKAA